MNASPSTTLDARSVDPGTLVIAANVRADTQVDKTFVSNLKQHGVIVPILVEEKDGQLEVIDGQRRTIGAIEAGLKAVPVLVAGAQSDAAARIIEQIVVNEHRLDITDQEEANAFGQLALLGVPASSIAKKTNLPVKRVQLAVDVASSKVAGAALVEHDLTLDQAAIVLEFEDLPGDVAELTASVKSGQFDHVASQIRDRRKRTALLEQETAALAAEGLSLWTGKVASYYENPKGSAKKVEQLYASEKRDRLTPAAHADCPHRAFIVAVGYEWVGNNREIVAERTEVCTAWKKAGHVDPYASSGSSSSSKPEKGSPEAEKALAERRLTIANNKLWLPSTEVRLKFVQELLQRKDLPADWERWVADHYSTQYGPQESREQAKPLLGIAASETFDTWLQANPAKAPQLLIAMAIAWNEARPEFAKSGWRSSNAKAYLTQLSKWGYTLSEIEERVVAGTATKVQK